jgi:hypothetical protein
MLTFLNIWNPCLCRHEPAHGKRNRRLQQRDVLTQVISCSDFACQTYILRMVGRSSTSFQCSRPSVDITQRAVKKFMMRSKTKSRSQIRSHMATPPLSLSLAVNAWPTSIAKISAQTQPPKIASSPLASSIPAMYGMVIATYTHAGFHFRKSGMRARCACNVHHINGFKVM